MLWLLGSMSYDLLYSKPVTLRADLQGPRWAWKTCPGIVKGEMEEMQEWHILQCCWTSHSQTSQVVLLVFTCTANEAFACSRAAINLCTICYHFLQSLILPFSYHLIQVQSIHHLILWNALLRCGLRQLVYYFDCIKKLHLEHPKRYWKYFVSFVNHDRCLIL